MFGSCSDADGHLRTTATLVPQADTTAQPADPATARAQLLKRLRSHVTTVSPALRQRAAGPRGDTSRLQRLLLKLIAGVLACAAGGDQHLHAFSCILSRGRSAWKSTASVSHKNGLHMPAPKATNLCPSRLLLVPCYDPCWTCLPCTSPKRPSSPGSHDQHEAACGRRGRQRAGDRRQRERRRGAAAERSPARVGAAPVPVDSDNLPPRPPPAGEPPCAHHTHAVSPATASNDMYSVSAVIMRSFLASAILATWR